MNLERRKFYQIDAFASKAIEGNQACVIPLDNWDYPDHLLQSISAENNVAETAYFVQTNENEFDLRWFTPSTEVRLCGHATLATAHVLFTNGKIDGQVIQFDTRKAGRLTVEAKSEGYEMNFPVSEINQIPVSDELTEALGRRPISVWKGEYLGAVFETSQDILELNPDYLQLGKIKGGSSNDGCIGCLAMGGDDGADITSRFFAPGAGINEDPATGSWHCMVAPIGKILLDRESVRCFQAFPNRGAWIETVLAGDRVRMSGKAVTVIEGEIRFPLV